MIARAPDGTALSYRVRGDGPLPIVFMHGWAGSRGYWSSLLDSLDLTGVRAVTYDLRGHGESDQAGRFTYETLVEDLLAVADAADAGRFVLAGFSMAAKFAQYVACTHPHRVRGLVLVAGCPASEIPFPAETRRDWSSRAGHPEQLREITAAYITRPVADAVLDSWARAAAVVPEHVLDESLRICTNVSFAERLTALHVPALVVGGLHDPIFSPAVLRAVQQSIRGARLVLVDSNHEVPIEAPRELASLISAFVAGLGPVEADA